MTGRSSSRAEWPCRVPTSWWSRASTDGHPSTVQAGGSVSVNAWTLKNVGNIMPCHAPGEGSNS